MEIRELTSTNEFREAYRLLTQLSDGLSEERFERQLSVMREEGYRMFGAYGTTNSARSRA